MTQTISFPGLGINDILLNRVAFSIFGHDIYWYGIIIAIAFLAGITYILSRLKTFGLDSDRVFDVMICCVIGGIIGARLYYVLFSWEEGGFKEDPMRIFKIWEGGIAIYGGVLGGLLVGWFAAKWRKVRFLPLVDAVAGGLILGQAIGRWGNFINIEAFGGNTTMPWGMTSPAITGYLNQFKSQLTAQGMTIDPSMPVHPTFFYESVWCLIGFILLALYTKRRRFDGEIALFYCVWYGAGRAVIEGLRTDSLMLGSMRVSQVLAILGVVASIVIWMVVRIKTNQAHDPDYLKLYVDTEEGKAVLAGTFYQQFDKKKKKDAETKAEENPGDPSESGEAEVPEDLAGEAPQADGEPARPEETDAPTPREQEEKEKTRDAGRSEEEE